MSNDNNYGLLSTGFYRAAEWIWRFAYLNLLWLGFSILGLGFLGIFPATAALYAVLRKWLTGERDISIIKLYWSTFKQDFLPANLLGYILAAFVFVVWYNFEYLAIVTGVEHTLILIFWLIAVVLLILLIVFLFPIYAHIKLPLLRYFSTTVKIALSSPLALITVAVGLWVAVQLFLLVPGLIPFYSVSTTGWLFMWSTLHAFRRIERKKERIEKNEDSLRFRWRQLKQKLKSSDE